MPFRSLLRGTKGFLYSKEKMKVWMFILSMLLYASCAHALFWLFSTSVITPETNEAQKIFHGKPNVYYPISIRSRSKSKLLGNSQEVYSSLFPSWIVPSYFQKIFKKEVLITQLEQDPRPFFICDTEIRLLKNILHGPPMFTVMLGHHLRAKRDSRIGWSVH